MEDIPRASRTVTRQEIRRMSSDQQRRFVKAVRKMMENPSGPGSSVFTRLASIHGYPGRIYCAHSRESFPAWHRAYLVAFERALQEADRDEGGDGDIALPYWDWAQITVRGEVYPRIVRDEFGDAPEGLLDPNDPDVRRRSSLQELLAEGFSGMVDDDRSVRSWLGRLGGQVDAALRVPEHYLFASTDQPDGIEWPHNTVHTRLGFPMQSVPVASFHPIFWLHHCNVDRQFAKYEELMPRAEDSFRRNQATASGIGPGDTNPEDDRNWYLLPLDPFVFNGRPVSVSDTFDSRFNSYRYDSLPEDPIRRFGIRTRDLPTQLEFTLERSKISSHTYAFFVFVMPKDEADEWVPPEDVNAWDHHPSLANSFSFFGGMDPEDCEGCRQEATITRYVDITEALERLGLSRHDCGIRVMVTEGYSTVMRLEDVPDVPAPKIVGSLFESMAAPLAKGGEPTPQETGEVKGLQTFLKRYGWLKEEPDGVFGDETEAAVKRFQKFAGLEEDGVAGPTTKGKILHERMDGVSDQHDEDDEATYQKGQEVTYWVGPPPSYLDADAVHAEVRSAFAAWAEVTGVLFKEVCRKGQSKIVVIWGRQSPDNIFKFDGPGGALAHSTKDYIQFDNSERWLCQGQPAARGSYYIYPVVLHSVGHVLGLTSSSCGDDVMSPFYFPDRVELQQGDKERAAALYGA